MRARAAERSLPNMKPTPSTRMRTTSGVVATQLTTRLCHSTSPAAPETVDRASTAKPTTKGDDRMGAPFRPRPVTAYLASRTPQIDGRCRTFRNVQGPANPADSDEQSSFCHALRMDQPVAAVAADAAA